MLSCGGCVTLFLHTTYLIVYRLEWSELVLFFFCETNIRNSWTSTLAAAPRTVRELVLFKRSFTSNLYGNFPWKNNLQLKATDLETEARISKFCQYSAMKSTVSLFLEAVYHSVTMQCTDRSFKDLIRTRILQSSRKALRNLVVLDFTLFLTPFGSD